MNLPKYLILICFSVITTYIACVLSFSLKSGELFSFKIITIMLFGLVIWLSLIVIWQIYLLRKNLKSDKKTRIKRLQRPEYLENESSISTNSNLIPKKQIPINN